MGCGSGFTRRDVLRAGSLAAAGLLAILLHSLLDFNLHIPAIAILVVTLMAVLSSQLRFATERYWFSVRTPLKCLATVVLVAGGCGVGWHWNAALKRCVRN